MADQDPGLMQMIIARLRPAPPKSAPGPQLDGWRMANQEHRAMGEPPESYADWAKHAADLGSK